MNPKVAARLRIAAILFVAILAQTTIAPDLRIQGVAPDFMLLVAICAGLTGGAEAGAFVGFIAGLLADSFLTDTPFGLSALSLCLIGYGVGVLRVSVLPDVRLLTPLVAFGATVAGVVLFIALGDVVGQHQLIAGGRSWLIRVAGIEAVWGGVLSLPVWWLYTKAANGSVGAEAVGARPDRMPAR
jgi:rod shape-determining protein MreD